MRLALACILLAAAALAEDLPITGIAHAGVAVSDISKARAFYGGTLGYQEPFDIKDDRGNLTVTFFKVNDDQWIEVFPSLKQGEDIRLTHVGIITSDIGKLREMLVARGLNPPAIARSRLGNLVFTMGDPEGNQLEFIQYLPRSAHLNSRGKHIGAGRISGRLSHMGILAASGEGLAAFYRDKLGFREVWRGGPKPGETRWINMALPGTSGDYIELMLYSGALSHDQRGVLQHMCFTVPDIQAAYKAVRARGVPEDSRQAPRLGINRKWQLNLYDPDGTRSELMEPSAVKWTPRRGR